MDVDAAGSQEDRIPREDARPALTETLSLAQHDVQSRAESICAKVCTAGSLQGTTHLAADRLRTVLSGVLTWHSSLALLLRASSSNLRLQQIRHLSS